MRHIVEGFLEIADNKFLHRDMKLANIFISSGMAKIADFGFAKKSQYLCCYTAHLLKRRSTTSAVPYICLLRL
jgi:serine/threonine protein kinase